MSAQYTEEHIKTQDWREHIRRRPGMYIGKLGDGSSRDDGIYILLKEVLDNAVDEFMMGFGKAIEIEIHEKRISVRDYGRGIPLGKMVEAASKMTINGLVANPNLIDETKPQDITNGYEFVENYSKESGLGLHFIAITAGLLTIIDVNQFECPILPIQRQLVPPWKKAGKLH